MKKYIYALMLAVFPCNALAEDNLLLSYEIVQPLINTNDKISVSVDMNGQALVSIPKYYKTSGLFSYELTQQEYSQLSNLVEEIINEQKAKNFSQKNIGAEKVNKFKRYSDQSYRVYNVNDDGTNLSIKVASVDIKAYPAKRRQFSDLNNTEENLQIITTQIYNKARNQN